jgi:hypothetical protein
MSAALSTQLAILRQRLEESQVTHHWRPEPGDTLLGTLRGLKPAQGPFGQGHMLIIIETEDGALWGLWLTAYLKAELEALHPGRLRALVREAIEAHIDNDELTALRLEEKAAREALKEMAIRVELRLDMWLR